MRVLYFIFALLVSVGIAHATSHAVFNGTTASQQPVIQSQTQSFTIVAGNTKTLSVTAIGAAPLQYQFFKNGVSQGAPSNTSTFITAILTQADNGAIYTAKVTNAFGSATTSNIQATVTTDIIISVQPQTQTVTSPATVTFTVAATGAAPLTCQWYKNGALISGATSCTTYTTPATTVSDSGSAFMVVFTDIYSTLHSNPGVITVMPPSTVIFVANSFGSSAVTSGATCTANVPTGTQASDVLLAFLSSNTATPGIPAGWFLITFANNATETSYLYYHVYAASGEPTSYSFTGLASPKCLISSYRNMNTNAPIDAFGICVQGSATNCQIPALSATAGPNEIYIGSWEYSPASGTITAPAGLIQRFSDGAQRTFWSGDQAINATGTIPSTQTASVTAGAAAWEGIGVTLISGTSITSNFAVSSPVALSTVNGIITAQGISGSQWVNVSAFDCNGVKISLADNIPTQGHWTLQIDTTKLPNAPSTCLGNPSTCPTITFTAFSVPSGQSGGTSVSLTVPYNVQNSNTTIFTVSAPVTNASVGGVAQPANGTCGTQWTGVQAFFGATSLSSIVPCVSGTWSLTMNTTLMPLGTQTITFQATASGFNPAAVQVSVNVIQPSNAFDSFGLPNTPTFPNTAVPAYAFLQSIGYDTWVANNGGSVKMQNMLTFIGVRWIRATGGSQFDGNDSFLRTLATNMNNANPNLQFKVNYIMNYGPYTSSNLAAEVSSMASWNSAGLLKFIEGHNEIDNELTNWNGVDYGGGAGHAAAGSCNGVAQFQAAVYAAVRGNSSLNNMAVSTPTYVGGCWDNSGMANGLSMPNPLPSGLSSNSPGPVAPGTQWADVLAAHTYALQDPPAFNNQYIAQTHGPNGNGHEPYIQDFVSTWNGHFPGMTNAQLNATPGLVTENGVHGGIPGNQADNSLRTSQANQLMDLYIEGFTGCNPTGGTAACIQGNKLNAPYSLVDGDGGFGNNQGIYSCGRGGAALCSPSDTFTPWPGATYLHNLTTILNDTTANFTPGSLSWTLSGCPNDGNGVSTCHGLLLQNSNGHFWVLQTYDWDGGSATNVTINFGRIVTNVNIYDPSVGTSVIATANGASSYSYTNNTGSPRFLELWP